MAIGTPVVSFGYAGIGAVAVLAGSIVSTRFALSARVRALVQHAAAGTVLAGLVVDVLDKLLHRAGQLVAAVALAPEMGLLA